MKKLFAFIMAVSMLVTASFAVLAEDTASPETEFSASASAEFKTSNGLDTYNANGTIDITVSLGEVAVPETVDGISAFIFEVIYDSKMVAPANSGEVDADGEEFDYTALIDNAPDGWECFGRIDSENASFELALWDATSLNPINASDALTVTVPFTVKPEAKADDIAFSFKNGKIHDVDIAVSASVEISGFSVEYALEPDVLSELPENAVPIDIAGYKDTENNVIYYAEQDITVGDYVASYTDDEIQKGMNDFAIIIVNADSGTITYADMTVDGDESDKSDVVIPQGHFILGVNADSVDDYIALCELAKIGYSVDIYNVNVETTGRFDDGVELKKAGFVIIDPMPVLKEGAPAVYDFENAIITVYDTELDIDAFKALFENDVTVLDNNGNELTEGYVATGMTIDYADGVSIVMMGDVHSDGKIDAFDYVLIKRYCLNTFEPTELQVLAARVAGNDDISVYDYVCVKRVCLGNLKLSDLM